MDIGLIASITSVVSLVHTAAETFKRLHLQFSERLHALDRHVKLLEFELRSTDVKLAEWKDLWCPDDLGTEASLLLLWGQAGRREIEAHLQSLEKSALTTTHRIEQLDSALLQSREKDQGSAGWFRRSLSFRTPQDQDQDHVIRKELQESVRTLDKTVTNLVATADTHFRSIHATTKTELQCHSQLKQIFESRADLDAIYTECRQKVVKVHIDLNLLNNDRDVDKFPDIFDWRDLKLDYHFQLFGAPAVPEVRNLRLESIPSSNIANSSNALSFDQEHSDPLHLWYEASELTFECTLDSSQYGRPVSFHGQICTPMITSEHELMQGQPLLSGLQETKESRISTRSTEHRIVAAYRIVESALFLLGTPWLSHLSHSTVVSHCDLEQDGQCSLRIDFVEPVFQMSDRQQVSAIGTLLVEIALGQPWQISDTNGVATNLPEEVAHRVKKNTNCSYMQACENCFHIAADEMYEPVQDTGLTNECSTKLLTAFYTDVFLRMRDCNLAIT